MVGCVGFDAITVCELRQSGCVEFNAIISAAVKGKPRNIVGPQVRRLRYQLGLSQNEFAARCQLRGWDVTRDVICSIELQRRWVANFEVIHLAQHLKVSVDALWPASVRRRLNPTRE